MGKGKMKKIIISKCASCPFNIGKCIETDRELNDVDEFEEIAPWCPLEEEVIK